MTDICSRAPRAQLDDPVARLVLFISCSQPYIRSPIRGVMPYSGDGGKQRAVGHYPPATVTAGVETSRRVHHFFFSLLCTDLSDSRTARGDKRATATQTRPHATAAGRCRSMSKQDCALNQSGGLKGHVGAVRARHPLTFNGAAAPSCT